MEDLTPRQIAHFLAVAALIVAVFADVQEHRWNLAAAAVGLFLIGDGIDGSLGAAGRVTSSLRRADNWLE